MNASFSALSAALSSLDPQEQNALASVPGDSLALNWLRRRNSILDGLFYDVGNIRAAEALKISPWLAREGAVIIVPPGDSGADLLLCHSPEEVAKHAPGISILTVAGVGSSALGAAAFARNVADALRQPVIAVVSGYGMADLAEEALGGFLMFGVLNSLRHFYADLSNHQLAKVVKEHAALYDVFKAVQASPYTKTVENLLCHKDIELKLLLGHSKGNLVISEALYGICQKRPDHVPILKQRLNIVTISAKIAMPRYCENVLDVMGSLDGFGLMNSRSDLPTDILVPNAWHHTNTELPLHLPVRQTLEQMRAKDLL